MEGSKDQCHTPLRKMSLRRKRCNKQEESESPMHKKISPPIVRNTMKKEDSISSSGQGVQEKLSQVYYTRRSAPLHAASPNEPPCTPKNRRTTRSRTKSTDKKKDMRSSMLEEQRQNQHSPDTPFISSQLCGTQECEVVWDCNSPGFSKDDLKRMSSIEESEQMPSPAIFVAPLPSRTLFPKLRPRPFTSVSAVNTTAQLDELLNQVATKGCVLPGSKRDVLAMDSDLPEVSTSSPIVQKFLLAPCPPIDSDFISSSLDIPDLNGMISSQPFIVREGKETADFVSGTEAQFGNDLTDYEGLKDDLWEEDLNTAICNVTGENEAQNVPSENEIETSASNFDSTSLGKIGRRDKSCNSTDMFDDDYFNDSLIQSTQLWETEILEKDSENSRSSRDIGCVLIRASELDYDSLHKQNGNSFSECISPRLYKEVCVAHKNVSGKPFVKSNFVTSLNPNNSESNKTGFSVKGSPVIGKKQLVSHADNPPKRRIRNTFRLNSISAINSAPQEMTKDTAVQMNGSTESDVNNLNSGTGNLSVSSRSPDTSAKDFSKQQLQCLAKTQVTEVPKQLKTDTSFLSDRCNKALSSVKTCKLPITHLESTGVAGNAKLSLISNPPKSEEKENPHEFEEEDSFFESLLCTIPEEDMLISKLKALDKSQAADARNAKSCNKVTKCSIPIEGNRKIQKNIINRDAHSTSALVDLNQTAAEDRATSSVTCENSVNTESENIFVHGLLSLQVDSAAGTSGNLISSAHVKSSHSYSNGVASKASTEDILDDDLFEDDVLSLIDEVESQFGSQPLQSQTLQLSQSPKSKCTIDEIARKKEEAQRRREENIKMEEIREKTKVQSKRKQNRSVSNFPRICEDLQNTRENTKNVGELSESKDVEQQRIKLLNTTKPKREKDDSICQQLQHQENENTGIVRKKEVPECRRKGSMMRQELIRGIGKAEESLKVDKKRKEEAFHQVSEWKSWDEIAMNKEAKEAAQKKEQIARKKEEAMRRREERLKSRQQTSFNPSVG